MHSWGSYFVSVPTVEVLTVIDYLTSEPLTEYMHASIDFQIIHSPGAQAQRGQADSLYPLGRNSLSDRRWVVVWTN
jgi:hypothetical protein